MAENAETDFISKTIDYTENIKLHLAYTKETSICVISRIDELRYPQEPTEAIGDRLVELVCGIQRKVKFEVKKNFLKPIFEKRDQNN